MAPPFPHLADYAEFRARADRERTAVAGRPPDQPLVSVVTVCRDARATIDRTIASVRAQTWPWIEHIVIDGGSRDGTWELIQSRQPFPGWCLHEPDQGISDAFNRGVAAAAGDFIAILNADDVFVPEAIAASLAALAAHPWAAWSFGGCDFSLDGEVVLHQDADPHYERVIHRTMPLFNHPTVVMRAAAYAEHGLFRTDLRLAMDYDLLLRFHCAGLRGVALDQTIAVMALGGASCRQILSAHREAAAISVDHGRHPLPAWLGRMRRSAMPLVRLLAQGTPLPRLSRALRRRRQSREA